MASDRKGLNCKKVIEKAGENLSILILSVFTFLMGWSVALSTEISESYLMVGIQCPTGTVCQKNVGDLHRTLNQSLKERNGSQFIELEQKDGFIFIRPKNSSGPDFITAAYDITSQAIDKLNETGAAGTIFVYIYDAPL